MHSIAVLAPCPSAAGGNWALDVCSRALALR